MKKLIKFYYNLYKEISKLYYKLVYKIDISYNKTMFFDLGRGKYVSVLRKGNYIDIIDEKTKEFIRLIPYQPNHGIMVEYWNKEKIVFRNHLSISEFKKLNIVTEE